MAIHPTAIIDPGAQLAPGVSVGPHAQIGPGVVLGEGCVVEGNALIGPNVIAGPNNRFGFSCAIGGEPQHLAFDPAVTSHVRIGSGNIFREMCTVHRGLKEGGETVIGDDCFLMVHSHVAHDCIVGNKVIFANSAALAGHVTIGDSTFFSAFTGVHQFTRVGRLVMVQGYAGIGKDTPPFLTMRGINRVAGLNVVGMRRAGISAETRTAIKRAYRMLLGSGTPLTQALDAVREDYSATDMPPEVAEIIEFCSVKSSRGYIGGRGFEQDEAPEQ